MHIFAVAQAKNQRKAANNAVNAAIHEWFPDETDQEPCLLELADDDGVTATDHDKVTEATSAITLKTMVLCEDYGQAVVLPSYRYDLILYTVS